MMGAASYGELMGHLPQDLAVSVFVLCGMTVLAVLVCTWHRMDTAKTSLYLMSTRQILSREQTQQNRSEERRMLLARKAGRIEHCPAVDLGTSSAREVREREPRRIDENPVAPGPEDAPYYAAPTASGR